MAPKLVTKEKTAAKGKSIGREDVIRGQLKEARDMNETSYVTMASLLHETYHNQYYTKWGHDDFEGYCDKELDFGYRKAKHLIEIWDKVTDLKLDIKRVSALGWTKMRDLVKILTAKNSEKWLKKAEDMSHREVQEAVRIVRQKEGDPGVRTTKTKLEMTMSEAEAQIILEAIETAKGLAETDNVVLAMEMICQEWLEYKGAVPEARSLDAQIDYLEKAYGVKLEVKSTKKSKAMDEVEAEVKATSKKGKAKKEEVEPDPLEDFDENPVARAKKATAAKKAGKATDQDLDDLLGL